jgi:hypothetical protein
MHRDHDRLRGRIGRIRGIQRTTFQATSFEIAEIIECSSDIFELGELRVRDIFVLPRTRLYSENNEQRFQVVKLWPMHVTSLFFQHQTYFAFRPTLIASAKGTLLSF